MSTCRVNHGQVGCCIFIQFLPNSAMSASLHATESSAAPAACGAIRDMREDDVRALEAVWRANELGSAPSAPTASSGFPSLDAELPGGGWPSRVITEILQPQPGVLEWRLLAPALSAAAADREVVVVGPPRPLYAAGLAQAGIDDRRLVWVEATTPAERLWVTEQLVKAGSCGAIVSWLPQARQEQIRRLQACAHACAGPVFLCRPADARHEASAAPLRALACLGADGEVAVRLVKRRGPVHDGVVLLEALPGKLGSVLTARARRAGPARVLKGAVDAVGSPASLGGRIAAAA